MNIKDIAKLAGVSTATVSRVINNKDNVKEDVKEKVRAIMEKYDYRPNLVARNLATKKTNLIGVFVPRFVDFYSERLDAILAYCNEYGYSVMIGGATGCFEGSIESITMLYEKQVEGLIYFVGKLSEEKEALINKINQKIPVVLVDQSLKGNPIPSIISDNYNGAKSILNNIYENGHRKIAFIKGPYYDSESICRSNAYLDFHKEKKLELNPKYHEFYGYYSVESGYTAAKNLYESCKNNLPTAILAANNQMAIGVINFFKDIGLSVPEDISVAGIDDIPIAKFFNPKITTMKQNQYEIGRQSIELLFKMLNKEKIENRKIIIPQELMERESIKKI